MFFYNIRFGIVSLSQSIPNFSGPFLPPVEILNPPLPIRVQVSGEFINFEDLSARSPGDARRGMIACVYSSMWVCICVVRVCVVRFTKIMIGPNFMGSHFRQTLQPPYWNFHMICHIRVCSIWYESNMHENTLSRKTFLLFAWITACSVCSIWQDSGGIMAD